MVADWSRTCAKTDSSRRQAFLKAARELNRTRTTKSKNPELGSSPVSTPLSLSAPSAPPTPAQTTPLTFDMEKFTLDNLPTYSGKPTENLASFVKAIERSFPMLTFDQDNDKKALQQGNIMACKLTGHAQIWFNSAHQNMPKFADLKKTLEDRFLTKDFKTTTLARLEKFTQESSLSGYNMGFLSLVDQIALDDETKIHFYQKGLKYTSTRTQIRINNPKTLDDAMRVAEACEEAHQSQPRSQGTPPHHSKQPFHKRNFKKRDEKGFHPSSTSPTTSSTSTPSRSGKFCTHCNFAGHTLAECYKKPKQTPAKVSTIVIEHKKPSKDLLCFEGTIDGKSTSRILVDTGANLSLISLAYAQQQQLPLQTNHKPISITYAQGTTLKSYLHLKEAQLEFGKHSGKWNFTACTLADYDIILGMDWIKHYRLAIDWTTMSVTTLPPETIKEKEKNDILVVNRIDVNADDEVMIIIPTPPSGDKSFKEDPKTNALIETQNQQTKSKVNSVNSTLTPFNMKEEILQEDPNKTSTKEQDKFFKKHNDVFVSEIPDTLPPLRQHNHTIKLKENAVVPRQRPYRASGPDQDEIKRQINNLMSKGLITPSTTPFGAPIILVKQKDKVRMVVNYKELNKQTIPDNYPLPNVQDLLDRLYEAKVYSKIDLCSGYHQIRIEEEDINKTGFTTAIGTYNFLVMPFGLTNAPATFQRTMNSLFQDLLNESVIIYLDDLLIYTKTTEEHKRILEEVISRLRENQFYAKLTKCELFRTKIDFLGHTITNGQMSTQKQKLEALDAWPLPTTLKSLQRFLGFTNYYRKFIKDYAKIAAPLYANCKVSSTCFCRTIDEKQSFKNLCEALKTATALTLPNPSKPFDIYTDASDECLGAVLEQDGKPIQFLSRKMSKTEMNYSVREKELMAILYALLKFRHYVLGTHINIYSDHKSLSQSTTTITSTRVMRWNEILSEYNYTIHYIPGENNIAADALSRAAMINSITTLSFDTDHIKQATKEDDTIKHFRQQLKFKDGIYYKENKMYVPPSLRKDIINSYHDALIAGHMGSKTTIARIRINYYWPSLATDVQSYIKSCLPCQQNKYQRHTSGLLYPHDIPESTWSTISMDFITHLPPSDNSNSILVVVDKLSKRTRLFPVTDNITSEETARLLVDNIFKIHGIPSKIISDRDPKFTSNVFKQAMSTLGIKQNLSTAAHPQTDGQTERVNQTIEQIIRNFISSSQDNWNSLLTPVEIAINSSISSSTNYSPYFIDTGRNFQFPLTSSNTSPTTDKHLEYLKTNIAKARLHLVSAQQRMIEQTNKKRRETAFEEGDQVMLSTKHLPIRNYPDSVTKKLLPLYIGPYKVSKKISSHAYRLDLPINFRIHNTFHVSLLKMYHGNNYPSEQPSSINVEGHEEYEVEEIIEERGRAGRKAYLVKWLGYPREQCTWEPVSNLTHCDEALEKWNTRKSRERKEGDEAARN